MAYEVLEVRPLTMRIGAEIHGEWRLCRLAGEAIANARHALHD